MKNTKLLLKSFAGMLFLLVFMALALFIPYGSLDYPLAWQYLAMFAGAITLITIYLFFFDKHLLQSRLAGGPVSEAKFTQKLIQSVAGLAFLAVYVLSAYDYRQRWSYVSPTISYTSLIICILSFVFLFFVFRQNTFLSATIEVKEAQKVVSTGLYSIIRHPMYTGALTLMLFTPLALGSYWALLPAAILTVVIVLRAIDEEYELKQNLPGYTAYCQKVRYRLIPFVF